MVCEQNTKHHCFTVGEHTIEVMKHVRNDKIMRLAALLHDIGKPGMKRTDKKGHDHFQGHPQLSDVMADNILRRLKYDNDTIKKVCMLVRYHDERPALNPRSIRRCMREMNLDFDDLFELKRADIAGQSDYMHEEKLAAVDKFEKLYHENLESGNCTDKKQLAVNGGDLIKAGVDKGPEMGRVMEKLLDDVIDEPSANTKETLLSRAKKYSQLAKKGKLLLSIFAVIFCISMGLTACADNRGTVSYRAPGTPLDASGDASADAKDSLDKVYIIEENNRDEGKLTVMNITSLREFRYPYNVSTEFLDKYGDTDSVEDFKPGMAITFDASGRYGMLTTVKKSNAVWEWDDLKNFSFDESISAMQFGGENYRYTDSTLFLDGNNLMERKDLIGGVDEVMVVGVDKEVLAVALTKGHGYLQLDDTKRFDNSLIQIGSYDAALVSSGKTFTVPVGTYAVTIANNGWGGTKNVKIKKNVTSVLNLESMKGKGPKSCRLKFEIDVDGAKIYLDGKRVKTDKTMTVLYGAHSLKVTADGYDDWERTLYVNSPTAVISLDISDSKQGSSNNSTATTNNSGTTNSSTNSSTTNDTNGSTVTTGNGSTATTSSGTTQKERDKAQENYLSTLADSVVNTLGSLSSD